MILILKPQKTNMETRQTKYITENSLRETLEIGLNPLFGTHGYQLYSISKVHNISKCNCLLIVDCIIVNC